MPTVSPSLRTVLDFVRATGKSAHGTADEPISDLVFMVATLIGDNPRALQNEVEAYADALDASV